MIQAVFVYVFDKWFYKNHDLVQALNISNRGSNSYH